MPEAPGKSEDRAQSHLTKGAGILMASEDEKFQYCCLLCFSAISFQLKPQP